ncbi:polysaccharide biosynthesis/export family protein [Roseobacter sinensis]|uniref:Polysaccharide biosynthesis/export family protein n=1 Tax=Roseobacter sinensis TaxID=2931391 RepID=A0ABT3BK44_9RHOB|nr:polysaccharide biosynthesis/export family protein [Roseobacter sp. WL0113]MCV3273952.1 polysaccharide biosynthesis/export family protein [Roseobacter sp. WL0113]
MKFLAPLICTGFLTACGVAYVTPQVSERSVAGLEVDVVPMTVSSVTAANAAPYTPRPLPAVYSQSISAGSTPTGAGAPPAQPVSEQLRPDSIPTLLPDPQPQRPYLIGVGDIVALSSPQLSSPSVDDDGAAGTQQRYTVQDDGAIAIANVGRVVIAGQTLEAAETELFQRFVENQIDPAFSLEILEFNSQRVNVGGAVNTPSVLPIQFVPLYLDDALTLAGGANASEPQFTTVRLYRDGTLYQVALDEVRTQRVQLQDGDSIFVDAAYDYTRAQAFFEEQIALAEVQRGRRQAALDQLRTELLLRRTQQQEARAVFQEKLELGAVDRDYVYLMGELDEQSRFALPFGQRAVLADAISSTGGIPNETGNASQIYVLRAGEDAASVNAWRLDGRNAANLILATRFELRPDDIVFVSEQPITRWSRFLDQLFPSLLSASVD